MNREIHPYPPFVPKNSRTLLIGSFPAKESGGWYYGSKRNQFWRILEGVYEISLATLEGKKHLLKELNLAVTDIILECERLKGTNLDSNLRIVKFNDVAIKKILQKHKIDKIYFSSRFVEKKSLDNYLKMK